MPLILYIHTALPTASVALGGEDEHMIQFFNEEQKDHAAWLQPAISQLMLQAKKNFADLDAVAVSAGPGSYTGLRVGYATAKGICFATNIPLISIGTLELMASSLKNWGNAYCCPAIDARREEIFTAIYKHDLTPVLAPTAVVLDQDFFSGYLSHNNIIFIGNANEKIRRYVHDPQAAFVEISSSAADMKALAEKHFANKHFADLAYAEPFYLKEFFDMKTFSKK